MVVGGGGIVVGGAVAGGAVAGGAVAGGLATGGVEGGGVVADGAGAVFPLTGGAVPDGAEAVFAPAGAVVAVPALGVGVGAVLALGDDAAAGGSVVGGVVVVDFPARVDVVVGVFAPEDVQAASSRPPATTTPSDRIMRDIRILLLVPATTRSRDRSMHW